MRRPAPSPLLLPILFFALMILAGTVLLHSPWSAAGSRIGWLDALFTATSATCVTGLTVVDTGTAYSPFGHGVILVLIQAGGLGIMTLTSLIFYLWRQRVSLTDRIAVGQSLLHDPSFRLGSFLVRLVLLTVLIEAAGAILLHLLAPAGFPPFAALFHAVSAFCNAGFSLYASNLMDWRGAWGINLVVMALIILGGIGFSVLIEGQSLLASRLRREWPRRRPSWYAGVVLSTSAFLVVAGAGGLYLSELGGQPASRPWDETILAALFQSVTCRTAGFNTLDIGQMTNISLLIMIILMFIGGAPGSCAGGIKVTTCRTLWAFTRAQLRGRRQAVIGRFAVNSATHSRAIILFVFASGIISIAAFLLTVTEGGTVPHPQAGGIELDVLFEAVSAFGTVGLSTGLTPKLSVAGKLIITALMFVGRLGPILFVAAMQSVQEPELFTWPEDDMLIG
ncbi:MAG: potassium transporter TrkG [Thermodesulfobacteriota bacterium]